MGGSIVGVVDGGVDEVGGGVNTVGTRAKVPVL